LQITKQSFLLATNRSGFIGIPFSRFSFQSVISLEKRDNRISTSIGVS